MPVFIENKFTYGVLVNFFLQKIMPLAYFYFGFLLVFLTNMMYNFSLDPVKFEKFHLGAKIWRN